MLTSSCKAKARKLQQLVRDAILKRFPYIQKDDVKSTPMGTQGADVWLSTDALRYFPYSVECKAQEGYGKLYAAYQQAVDNTKNGTTPLVVIRSNNTVPLVVLSLEHFLQMQHGIE